MSGRGAGAAGSCSRGGAAGGRTARPGVPRGRSLREAAAAAVVLAAAAMSVQVAAPAVELKELSGPMDKAAGSPCEPVAAHPPGHGVAAAPCPLPATEREAAPAPASSSSSSSGSGGGGGGERPPLSGCPGLSAATKVPQASAMKRSDPHHPQHRHRDGGDGGGPAAEALVSPDGTVTEAPRTVKKVTGKRGGGGGGRRPRTPTRGFPGTRTPGRGNRPGAGGHGAASLPSRRGGPR